MAACTRSSPDARAASSQRASRPARSQSTPLSVRWEPTRRTHALCTHPSVALASCRRASGHCALEACRMAQVTLSSDVHASVQALLTANNPSLADLYMRAQRCLRAGTAPYRYRGASRALSGGVEFRSPHLRASHAIPLVWASRGLLAGCPCASCAHRIAPSLPVPINSAQREQSLGPSARGPTPNVTSRCIKGAPRTVPTWAWTRTVASRTHVIDQYFECISILLSDTR